MASRPADSAIGQGPRAPSHLVLPPCRSPFFLFARVGAVSSDAVMASTREGVSQRFTDAANLA